MNSISKIKQKLYRDTHKDEIKQIKKLYIKSHYDEIKQQRKIYYEAHKDYFKKYNKEYNETHKDEIKQLKKLYIKSHCDEIKQQRKIYYEAHKDDFKQYNKEYSATHKDEIKQFKKNYQKIRRNSDPIFKLICNVRNRISTILQNKSKHTIEYLGCSIEFLFNHIEKQFTNCMSWNNYGKWHIDHIVPLMYNNPTDIQIIDRLHWTNIQPLWKEDNIKKSNNAPTDDELLKRMKFQQEYCDSVFKKWDYKNLLFQLRFYITK